MSSFDTKSTLEEIRARFDADVERFSNLDTGQKAIPDAPLMMELLARAAVAQVPDIQRVLDVGCGAGNNTLKLRSLTEPFHCDLVDLSRPMLDRARERLEAAGCKSIRTFQSDLRVADLEGEYDVILAAAVLHHLRDDADWETAFGRLFELTAPGGILCISDMVTHEVPALHAMMWDRYGDYLESLDGPEYRDKVFAYIEKEDSPRPLTYQVDLLRRVGFAAVDVLFKYSCFATFVAVKEGSVAA